MITDSYDIESEPIISISDFYGEKKHVVDVCLIILSKKIYTHLLESFECVEIARLSACNGEIPIYKMLYRGREIAFYLSAVGSAVASSLCYEASWVTGANSFIIFGSCGSLDRNMTAGKFIVPTESYRGEGCSYYFAKPSDYISIRNCTKVSQILSGIGAPFVMGRIWTTDSMIRETVGLVQKRRSEGCIAVEMEIAGVQATCDFYGLELYSFLEAGDVLEEGNYDVSGLATANHDLGKLYIALEIALCV